MIEIGERPRGISLRGELKLQLAVSTEAKPDSSSLNKLKTQLKVKNCLIKWGASSRWSFGSISAWGSIETATSLLPRAELGPKFWSPNDHRTLYV